MFECSLIESLPKTIPKINLLSYSINPIFKDNYEKCEEDFKENFFTRKNYVRVFLIIFFTLLFTIF